jgi:hypothetical protein
MNTTDQCRACGAAIQTGTLPPLCRYCRIKYGEPDGRIAASPAKRVELMRAVAAMAALLQGENNS